MPQTETSPTSPRRNMKSSASTSANPSHPADSATPARLKIKLDAMTLSDVISKTHPSDIASTLQSSLKTATPDDIRVLSKLLRPLLGKALIKKTCVRCDQEYLESQNDEHSCVVAHSAEPEEYMDPDSEWPDDASEGPPEYIIYPCCELVVEADEQRYNDDECYTTKHTTDLAKIDFYGFEERLEKKRARGRMV